MTDQNLLEEYAMRGSEEAFAELVERHKDWVYSSCLRRLGDPAMAEDATQVVLITLARKARVLQKHRSLMGWLYRAAKFTALNMHKLQKRRTAYEAKGGQMIASDSTETDPEVWKEIAPGLEAALDRLPEKYRLALLLRFYQKKSHGEIGAILGISTEGARKRVERGVERLRNKLTTTKGVSASVLGVTLLAHGVQPARAGISAPAMAQQVAAGTGVSWNTSTGVMRMMFMAKVNTAAAVLGVVMLSGGAAVLVAQMKEVPAKAAATAPALSAEPIKTLASFQKMFTDMDGEAFPELVDMRDKEVADLVHATQERLRIGARLKKAMMQRKVDETVIQEALRAITGGSPPFTPDELAKARTTIDGDTATVTQDTLGVPDSVMLFKLDGKWKLDLLSTFKKAADGHTGEFTAMLEKENPQLAKLVEEVEKGELASTGFTAAYRNSMESAGHGGKGSASGPLETLERFGQAFTDANAEVLPDLVDMRDKQVADLIHAVQERLKLVARLRQAMKEKEMEEKAIMAATQELTGGKVVTAQQLAHARTAIDGETATVIRDDQEQPEPVTLVKLDGKWKLDLPTLMKKVSDGRMPAFTAMLGKQNPLLAEVVGKVEKGQVPAEEAMDAFAKAMEQKRDEMGVP